ncbi:MAG TPA: alpha/beta fold hydrolase, partial [Reyranella sp.]|nr:alpha/beta fold hydrolase [Reyranella sp.]
MRIWTKWAAGLTLAAMVTSAPTIGQPSGPGGPAPLAKQPANVDVVKVHGRSLEGNLEGDPTDIEAIIALPPNYKKDTKKRYPVVYFLHGYFFNVDQIDGLAHFGDAVADEAKKGHEFILVAPDGGRTKWAGSMWSSSPTIGDWEGFVSKDLVDYVDSHYRTIAKPAARGLGGHSMGGYGTWRIAMKHPGVFGAIYGMSACCMSARTVNPGDAKIEKMTPEEAAKAGFGDRAAIASAAGWSSNPTKPPFFYDWLTKDGVAQPEIVAQWAANAPLAMVSQYVQNLKTYNALGIEIGTKDGLIVDNKKLDALLTQYGLKHSYTTFDGGRTKWAGSMWSSS